MSRVSLDVTRLRKELEAICGQRRVSVREDDLDTYSRDMWPRLLLGRRAQEHSPYRSHLIVWPESPREVAAIVRACRSHRAPIIPYGGGSGVCGGAVPLMGGVTVDTKRMTTLRAVRADELIADVDAGLNGERFERELARRGYTFGHFPSSIYCSTVGGWIATRAAGQLSTKYGKIEDRVVGLTVVTGKGDIIETDGPHRAIRGPNWTQLLVGSEGTLGIVTSARLRVSPAPQIQIFRGFHVENVGQGVEAIRRILQRGLRPAVVRLYDEVDTMMSAYGHHDEPGGVVKPDHSVAATPRPSQGAWATWARPASNDGVLGRLRRAAEAGAASLKTRALSGALAQAGLVNRVAGTMAGASGLSGLGLGKGCRMIIGLEGARIRTETEASLTFSELEGAGARDMGEEPGLSWLEHRYAVAYTMSPMFRVGAFVDTMEVATTWDKLLDLYHAVREAIGKHAVVMAHFSHAYAEGCSIYFTFAGHAKDARASEALYDRIWRDGLEATVRVGATISHHHGVGLLKAPYMASEHRAAMAIFEAAKHALDPDGIMNPGKMGLAISASFAAGDLVPGVIA